MHSATVDPKCFDEKSFVDINSDVTIIPPNPFALARTVEYFRIPRNVLTICLGKSTPCPLRHYRPNVTPLEPEWGGMSFPNTTNLPVKIYANEGVAQMLFLSRMKRVKSLTKIVAENIKDSVADFAESVIIDQCFFCGRWCRRHHAGQLFRSGC